MKRPEIDNEALRKRYSPDGSKLRRDQLELVEMLKFLDDICKKHNIRWWLSSGTLIGAARHGGFIPWDDDLDIAMLRSDYKRLKKILLELNDERYVLHCMDNDVEYVNLFGKLRKREGVIGAASRRYNYYKWRGIGLDIFPVERSNYLAARIASVLYNNLQHLTSYIKWGWLRKPLIRLIEGLCLGVVFPLLRLIGLINPRGEYHYALGVGWPKSTIFMNETMPLERMSFEGVEMPVPKDTDAYLRRIYGTWWELPSDEAIKRAIHCREYREEIYGSEA
jgi:lipopolysaccharide cholinephosphotransferase